MNVNWELRGCCDRDQRIFIAAIGVSTVVILLVSASPSPTPPPILSLPGCFVLFSRDSGGSWGFGSPWSEGFFFFCCCCFAAVEDVPAHAVQAHHRLPPRDQPRARLQAHLRRCKPNSCPLQHPLWGKFSTCRHGLALRICD